MERLLLQFLLSTLVLLPKFFPGYPKEILHKLFSRDPIKKDTANGKRGSKIHIFKDKTILSCFSGISD